jgi:hypothetical protein
VAEPEEDPHAWVEPPAPQLRPGVRRRAAIRALRYLALVSLVATLAAIGLDALGRGRSSMALVVGHGIAQLVTCSWVIGALVGFDGDTRKVLRTTLGLSPFRMMIAAAAIVSAAFMGLEEVPLLLSFVVTYLLGHVIEALLLGDLAAGVETSE